MLNSDKNISFYLGVNSPQGFISHFDQLLDPVPEWKTYIIKGGPGTGKSGLMKKMAEELGELDENIEYIYCSADPNSLDGIIFNDLKINIVDGTPPHELEPRYPGAVEDSININECWDSNKLKTKREDIIKLVNENKSLHAKTSRYLAAANSLLGDTYRTVSEFTDSDKILKYASKLCKREFKNNDRSKGKESVRFLSAVTLEGIKPFVESINSLAEKVYIIEDNYGSVCRLLLSVIRDNALKNGYNCISCYCPMSPYEKLEHIIIPELKLAFVTSNYYHKFDFPGLRKISAKRFIDSTKLSERRQRLNFNKKAIKELLNEAIIIQKKAKSVHDKIEECYIPCMDFKKVDKLIIQLINKIKTEKK